MNIPAPPPPPDAARHQRITEIFLAAARTNPQARPAVIESECGGDVELRRDIESLLRHHDDSSLSLETPALGRDFRLTTFNGAAAAPDARPAQVSGYRILDVLGEGGMGVVYLAEQENPRRTVALKLVKSGVMSDRALRRFEIETQVLGRLQHPGIAQILEAGAAEIDTPMGRRPQPYFAMEFVRGRPLLDYATEQSLTTRQKLDLFIQVCQAVQHAHQQGVIHRDLKPSNILVDAEGRPKILDFGVARSTDADVQTTTLQTDIGQLIGTIPYMSPEQATGDPARLDARSDVYSLGVILFELLTGRLPHDLRGKTIPDAARIISQNEPTRLATVDRAWRGDLDTIAARALERDPNRRYPSASELALDVQRFLDDQPILARAPSAMYQLRKFARRNRVLVGGVAAVAVVLIAALVVVALLLVRAVSAESLAVTRQQQAERAESVALDRLRDVEAAEALAGQRLHEAELEFAKAEATKHFLQEMLSSIDPASGFGKDVTVRQMLDVAAAKIDAGSLTDQPHVEASIRLTIGNTYRALGLYQEAARHLHRMVELRRQIHSGDSQVLAAGLTELGIVLWRLGDLDGAEAAYRESLDMKRRLLGDEHQTVATAINGLAVLMESRGDFNASETLQRQALAIRIKLFGPEHEHVALSLSNLGSVLQSKGDLAQAEPHYLEALRIRRAVHGQVHYRVAETLHNLGSLARERGDLPAAQAFTEEALRVKLLIHDRANSTVGVTLALLSAVQRELRQWDQAEASAREALAIMRKAFGDRHQLTCSAMTALAGVFREAGRLEEAEAMLLQALEIEQTIEARNLRFRTRALAALGEVRLRTGNIEGADMALSQAVQIQRDDMAPGHPDLGVSLALLGEALLAGGRPTEAEPLLAEALAIRQRTQSERSWRTAEGRALHAACLAKMGHADEARLALEASIQELQAHEYAPAWRIAWAMRSLADVHERAGDVALAEEWRARAASLAGS